MATKFWLVMTSLTTLLAASGLVLLIPVQQDEDSSDINSFMTEAYYTEFNISGQVNSTIYTPQMIHYMKENVSYFTEPDILTYASDRTPWLARSKEGKSTQDNKIDLWGSVHFHQLAYANHPDTKITTEAMTLYPQRSYAETAKPVTLTRFNMQIQAVGLNAYLNRGVYKLLSQPKGHFDLRQQ